jgi:hypothetical protein
VTSSLSRRLNFTSRSKIKREWISAELTEVESIPALNASVDLSGLDLPADAKVVLEAARGTVIERLDLGTVGLPTPIIGQTLGSFTNTGGITVSIKVVAVGEQEGRLLAKAAPVVPDGGDDPAGDGKPLLSFRPDDGLGQVAWSLDFTGEHPVVLMNADLDDWNGLARSGAFVSLVYPEILRRIALWVASTLDEDTDEGPVTDWAAFLKHLGRDPRSRDLDVDVEDWASEVATRFADSVQLRNRFWETLAGGTS